MRLHCLGRRAALLGVIAGFAAAGAPAGAAVPIEVVNRQVLVDVLLDGRLARLVLDTGAETTLVTQTAVRRLGLHPDPWVSSTLRGAGGLEERHANVNVREALAGAARLFQRQPGSFLSLPVTSSDLGGADGLLGGDVLRHYALELNLRSGRLVLLAAQAAARAPNAVPLQSLGRNLLLAPVMLDGHRLTALLDTGSSASLVNARGMIRLGLAPAQLQDTPEVQLSAVGGRSLVRRHHFAEFRIGALTVSNPIFLVELVPAPAYDLVLGLDVLGQQALLLSYTGMTLNFS